MRSFVRSVTFTISSLRLHKLRTICLTTVSIRRRWVKNELNVSTYRSSCSCRDKVHFLADRHIRRRSGQVHRNSLPWGQGFYSYFKMNITIWLHASWETHTYVHLVGSVWTSDEIFQDHLEQQRCHMLRQRSWVCKRWWVVEISLSLFFYFSLIF